MVAFFTKKIMNITFKMLLSICAIVSFSSHNALGGLFSGLGSAYNNAKQSVSGAAKNLKQQATNAKSNINQQVTNTVTNVKSGVQGVVTKVETEARGAATNAKNNAIKTIADVNNTVQGAKRQVSDGLNVALGLQPDIVTSAPTTELLDTKGGAEGFMLSGHWYDPKNAKVDVAFEDTKDLLQNTWIINLRGLEFVDEDIPYVAEYFEELAKFGLEKCTLDLSNNKLTAVGVSMLFEALQLCPNLVSILNVSKNQVGDEGATLLATNLHNLPTVTAYVISDAGITGDGILALLKAITEKRNFIQLFDLSGNKLTNDYWQLVASQCEQLNEEVLKDGLDLSKNELNLPQGTVVPEGIRL
jgi:hypothetical protein